MDSINKTQFVYKRTITLPATEEGEGEITKTVLDSFNISNVIRSITMDDGGLLILLDDIHTRYENRPKIDPRTNNPKFHKGTKMPIIERVEDTFQSEIRISAEEAKEFFRLTSINNYESTD